MGELPPLPPEVPRPDERYTAAYEEHPATSGGFSGYVNETTVSPAGESALTSTPDMAFADEESDGDQPPTADQPADVAHFTPRAEAIDRPAAPADAPRAGEPPIDKPPPGSREAGGEGEEPLLPSTASDSKWEEWFGGQVIVVRGEMQGADRDADHRNLEVAKIYRSVDVRRPNTDLVMPSGASVPASLRDIFQIYEPDPSGALPENPSAVFQFNSHAPGRTGLPKGYYAEEPPLPPELEDLRTALVAMAAAEAALPQTPPIAGRRNLLHPGLNTYSMAMSPFHKTGITDFSGSDMSMMYVHYPIGGQHMHVIMPGGHLLTGQSWDIVEQLRETPLMDGYEALTRERLGRLALKQGYIII